jgi:DNA polymerase III epsilon subunit-like protein
MIVLDVESTGLIPEKHSILSLGAIDFDEPENQFYEECRIWPGAEIEDTALAVNGFSREGAVSPEKQSEAELIASFIAWATDRPKDRTLAAQNPSFDLEFVQAAAKRAG